jgi:hypothetical protein
VGWLGRTEDKRKGSHEGWNGLLNKVKLDSLSKETTKQHQTTSTTSKPSEPATTGAPLPCGDALVAYEKLKREKNNEGKENDFKRTWKFDICVGEVRNNCD